MSLFGVLLLALSMAVDAFAVCLSAGSLPEMRRARPAFRLAFHFGLFQFAMPVLGWLAGETIEPYIRDYDHWLAFGMLAYIGGRMIFSASRKARPSQNDAIYRGWSLVLLSFAVSIDALAVGLSLGVLGIVVWYPALLIGLVTGLLSLIGLRLGRRASLSFGKPVEVIGGVLLIGIGLQILLSHLMG